ncbi:MAG: monofunctional biosynthetic peptidoglycan transglycosylase [Bacteroidota bacterium]
MYVNRLRLFLQERISSTIDWSRGHKVRAVVYGICIMLLLEYLSLPNIRLQELEKVNPQRTALMEQRAREAAEAGKPYHILQSWVPLYRISPFLAHAVIVSEDGTFYENGGVDWYEVQESIETNLEKGKALRGASTISQQLAKNLFLSTSKDPLRKLKELVITLRMERVLSKERILEIYLNVIEMGNGVFGVEAAAQKYFGKSASAITREEAAQLAAVIPSPLRHQPNQSSQYVDRRASLILERMTARGF